MGDEDQRLEAAVSAERLEPTVRDQDRSAGGEATSPSVRTRTSAAEPGRAAQPGRAAEPGRAAQPVRVPNAGPVAEDDVTEWLGTAGGPRPSAARPSAARPSAGQSPAGQSSAAQPAEAGPGHPGPASWLGAGIAALVVIPALIIGSLAVVVVRHLAGPRGSAPPGVAPARQEAAARDEAAAWVAQQVSPDVTVSCDPVMCAALEARGFPSRDLLMLGPVSLDPRHSAVVVETPAVRALFGTSLDMAWAPAVLASFGSGSAGITVRVIASRGAFAYQTALAADLADRKSAGARLLTDRRITVPAFARGQLTAGLVDLRLLSALTALSRHQPVSLVGFGNVGPGADAGVPLRYADLSETGQATHAAFVRSVRAYLSGLNTRFRPVRTVPVVLPDGQAVLRVEFTAPSPLGVSGTPGS